MWKVNYLHYAGTMGNPYRVSRSFETETEAREFISVNAMVAPLPGCVLIPPTLAEAANADDFLTALASVPPENRSTALGVCGLTILREAADLCGIDSTDMSKRAAIKAIIENF